MEILAFIAAVLVGIVGFVIFGRWFNWGELGLILEIAVMGAIILWAVRHSKK